MSNTRQISLLHTNLPAGNDTFSAGIDEAGRGCLAGPVVAAAVILPPTYDLPNLTDSKKLSERQRNILFPEIKKCALAYGIGLVWPRRIDQINILQATFEAMAKATLKLSILPTNLLIDGNKIIPNHILNTFFVKYNKQIPRQKAIVKGDSIIDSISAASILAKTYRDYIMTKLDKKWNGYGFSKHKGYGTKEHYDALNILGPSPMHRLSFNCAKENLKVQFKQAKLT